MARLSRFVLALSIVLPTALGNPLHTTNELAASVVAISNETHAVSVADTEDVFKQRCVPCRSRCGEYHIEYCNIYRHWRRLGRCNECVMSEGIAQCMDDQYLDYEELEPAAEAEDAEDDDDDPRCTPGVFNCKGDTVWACKDSGRWTRLCTHCKDCKLSSEFDGAGPFPFWCKYTGPGEAIFGLVG
ncbi:Uu.00g127600.m01.CDS01 [Anthostomella pinea]|uniref:Uu.00g127600.m01.CDS01 n=1 Tax=Anthostomella pinea TaxID=933095 RepID=A0AAI8VIV9_9PEZI|nr:Uu.00g127600.m01.CDS01 [Anthostomella pinea]